MAVNALRRASGSDAAADPESLRRFTRRLALIGAVGVIGFAWIHGAARPDAVDPMWQRILVASCCLGVFVGSWLLRPRQLVLATYGAYYVLTIWIVQLLVRNQMAEEYALALVVVAAGIAGTFQERKHLLYYQAVTLGGIALAAVVVDAPQVDLLVYLTYALMMAALSFMAVSARLELDVRRALSEERYELAARGANDGLWEWDLATGRARYSPRFEEMLGLEPGTLGADPEAWLSRIHPEDGARFREELKPPPGRDEIESEYRIRGDAGMWRWMAARATVVRDEKGRVSRLSGSQTDVTEQKRAEQQLIHETLHDALTGLPNRVLLLDRLERLLASGQRRPDHGFGVLFLDLDRFKRINDSLGHRAGDKLLVEVSRRLQAILRDEDTLARVGSDEFVVVVPTYDDREDVIRLAERLQEAVRQPYPVTDPPIHLWVTIGIALGPGSYDRPEGLLRDADIAMYRAKQTRRTRPQLFDGAMHRDAVQTLRLETELRRALDNEELVLHYQPIVRLGTGEIDGLEALVRWRHPDRGLLAPGDFLPLAEETGLIVELGRWALREACRAQRRWRVVAGDPPPTVHVNLSGSHFLAGTLVADVEAALAEGGPETRLGVEITESVLLADPGAAAGVLSELRARKIGIAIDDFGTGYSSLRYLHSLPADILKIDRSFVQRCEEPAGGELIHTIIMLAERMGMTTVAEGVETRAAADWLEGGGASHAQGFFFGPAVGEEHTAAALAAGRWSLRPQDG